MAALLSAQNVNEYPPLTGVFFARSRQLLSMRSFATYDTGLSCRSVDRGNLMVLWSARRSVQASVR